jgi:hypothetical protein
VNVPAAGWNDSVRQPFARSENATFGRPGCTNSTVLGLPFTSTMTTTGVPGGSVTRPLDAPPHGTAQPVASRSGWVCVPYVNTMLAGSMSDVGSTRTTR